MKAKLIIAAMLGLLSLLLVLSIAFASVIVPDAPRNVSASVSAGPAIVSFDPPASDGGSAIISYIVTSDPEGITAIASGSPIRVLGLTNGIPHTFTVTAVNAVGPGLTSDPSNSVTPLTAASVTIDEFTIPSSNAFHGWSGGITGGPDGNLWFTESGDANKIGRMTPAGVFINEFPIPTASSLSNQITKGPDGNLWFTEHDALKIGMITPAGNFTEFPIPSGGTPVSIIVSPDGNLWFSEYSNKVGRITTAGIITEFDSNGPAEGIAVGPDNNIWLAAIDNIEQMTTDGDLINLFPLPEGSCANTIATGADGNLWYNGFNCSGIGRITPSGDITVFPIASTSRYGMSAGPDGSVWFAEYYTGTIGMITPDGLITEFPVGHGPWFITVGPDNNLWFNQTDGLIGKLAIVSAPGAPKPFASFMNVVRSGTHGMGLDFASTSKDALGNACTSSTCSYSWSFGSGSTPAIGTNPNQSVIYSTNGTRSITLTVTDIGHGTTYSSTKNLNITRTNTAPTVTASASTNASWTATLVPVTHDADGDTVTVSSVNWGDGTPANTSLTHTYSALPTGCGSTNGLGCAGLRGINVTVTDGTASASTSTSVTLNRYVISGTTGEVGVSVALGCGPTTGTVTSGSNGAYSITVNPGTYTLTASKTGRTFGPTNPITGVIVGPNSSGNNFAAVKYILTVARQLNGVTTTTSGSVISSPVGISCGTDCTEPYNSGQVVVLSSTAPSGKNTTWTGCDAGSGGTNLTAGVTTCSVTMSGPKNVTVNYVTPAAPTLTVIRPNGYGTVLGGGLSCNNTTPAGNTCGPVNEVLNGSYTLTATPASGHVLASATDCTVNFTITAGGGACTCAAYNKCNIQMTTSKTVQVNFNH